MSKTTLNPRLLKIYKLLREFGLSEVQAGNLAKKTYYLMPKDFQTPTQAEIDDVAKGNF